MLAQALNPGLAGVLASIDATTNKPNVAAVPGAFGPLTPISVTVGPLNADGTRNTLMLETPSLNSLAYPDVTCA